MPTVAELLRHHVSYSNWATRRLLAEAATLTADELSRDFGTADKSVLGTLVHIFRAERIWLARIQEMKPLRPFAEPVDEHFSTLAEHWPELQNSWQQWIDSISEQQPETILTYSDLKGRTWAQPVWQIVLHVVNHSTQHRGQVSGFLRGLGKTPPPLDFTAFTRERLV